MSDEQPVGKAERQQALVERIIGGQQPSQPARAELERLLGPDELAKVDERLLAVITDEGRGGRRAGGARVVLRRGPSASSGAEPSASERAARPPDAGGDINAAELVERI